MCARTDALICGFGSRGAVRCRYQHESKLFCSANVGYAHRTDDFFPSKRVLNKVPSLAFRARSLSLSLVSLRKVIKIWKKSIPFLSPALASLLFACLHSIQRIVPRESLVIQRRGLRQSKVN